MNKNSNADLTWSIFGTTFPPSWNCGSRHF